MQQHSLSETLEQLHNAWWRRRIKCFQTSLSVFCDRIIDNRGLRTCLRFKSLTINAREKKDFEKKKSSIRASSRERSR